MSARVRDAFRSRNARSRLATNPVGPAITEPWGRTIGSGKKCRSSRASRGHRPALRYDDLPAPEAPKMTNMLSTPRSLIRRSASRPRVIAASRPKKMATSSASSGFRPRYGARSRSCAGGQGNVAASNPVFWSPILSRRRPPSANDTSASTGASSDRALNTRRSAPATRSHSCHSDVISAGIEPSGVGATRTPKIVFPSCLASRNSARHHFESHQAGEMRMMTTSQRSAADFRASCHRAPTARP
jgi:hypothetical protein